MFVEHTRCAHCGEQLVEDAKTYDRPRSRDGIEHRHGAERSRARALFVALAETQRDEHGGSAADGGRERALENDERVDGGDPAHGVVADCVRHEQRVGQRVDGVEKQSRERRQHETKDEFMHGRRSERELLFAEGGAAHFASSTLKAIL